MFTQKDFSQIAGKGMDEQVIRKQIDRFIAGFPFIRLVRPATAGDGILKFDDKQQDFYQKYFEKKLPTLKVLKFVPASGAASRMFKHLFEFINYFLCFIIVYRNRNIICMKRFYRKRHSDEFSIVCI